MLVFPAGGFQRSFCGGHQAASASRQSSQVMLGMVRVRGDSFQTPWRWGPGWVSFSGLSEEATEAKMVHVPTGYGQVLLEAREDTS